MQNTLILASASTSRQGMLAAAGVPFESIKPQIDEQNIKASLRAEGYAPDEIADALAEAKAQKISGKMPGSVVLGSDQVLALDGQLFSKPENLDDLKSQLRDLRGKTHDLYAAAVLYDAGKPVWRHTTRCRMTMRQFSDEFLINYAEKNFDTVKYCVGGYEIEGEGIRLFSRIQGDQFSIMGMPLLELLNHLTLTGVIQG